MTRVEKRPDGYWVVELPFDTPDCGPYQKDKGIDSDTCAQQAMKDLERFFLFEYLPIVNRKKVTVRVKRVS